MKRSVWSRLLAAAIAAASLLALAGCGQSDGSTAAGTDDSLQKVTDSGKLVLGLDASFPPMGYRDAFGTITGFDIDVAQEVCDRLGVELINQPIDWDEKETLLNDGSIDCIWNGMSVTPARAETMNLSEPYMKNEMVFLVSSDSQIKSISDLKGATVGVQSGSTAEELLEASELSADVTTIPLENNIMLLTQLALGHVDAVFLDSIVAYYMIKKDYNNGYVLPGNLAEEEYAVGFRKGDQTLRDAVQQTLDEMNADGTLAEISVKWFGSDITSLR